MVSQGITKMHCRGCGTPVEQTTWDHLVETDRDGDPAILHTPTRCVRMAQHNRQHHRVQVIQHAAEPEERDEAAELPEEGMSW